MANLTPEYRRAYREKHREHLNALARAAHARRKGRPAEHVEPLRKKLTEEERIAHRREMWRRAAARKRGKTIEEVEASKAERKKRAEDRAMKAGSREREPKEQRPALQVKKVGRLLASLGYARGW